MTIPLIFTAAFICLSAAGMDNETDYIKNDISEIHAKGSTVAEHYTQKINQTVLDAHDTLQNTFNIPPDTWSNFKKSLFHRLDIKCTSKLPYELSALAFYSHIEDDLIADTNRKIIHITYNDATLKKETMEFIIKHGGISKEEIKKNPSWVALCRYIEYRADLLPVLSSKNHVHRMYNFLKKQYDTPSSKDPHLLGPNNRKVLLNRMKHVKQVGQYLDLEKKLNNNNNNENINYPAY